MANGRLASVTVPANTGAKVFTNTTGNALSIAIHATTLSGTANSNICLGVQAQGNSDLTLNYLVLDTQKASLVDTNNPIGSVFFADLINQKTAFMFYQNVNGSSDLSYWLPSSNNWQVLQSNYNTSLIQRIDPYYLYSPTQYGRTLADWISRDNGYYSSHREVLFYVPDLNNSILTQLTTIVNGSHYSVSDPIVAGFERSSNFSYGMYDDCCYDPYGVGGIIGQGASGNNSYYNYMTHSKYNTISKSWQTTSRSSDSGAYQYMFGNNYYAQNVGANGWIRGKYHGDGLLFHENGVVIVNSPIYTINASISDGRFLIYNSKDNTDPFYTNFKIVKMASSGITENGPSVLWMKYNPNNDRYYIAISGAYGTTGIHVQKRGIYEFSFNGIANFTTGTVIGSAGDTTFTRVADLPTGTGGYNQNTSVHASMTPPRRIAKSLWTASCYNSSTGVYSNWLSTNLYTWVSPSTYYTSLFNSGTAPENTSLLQGIDNIANYLVNRNVYSLAPGLKESLNQTTGGFLEYDTKFGNYQRSGIVLSNLDTLYVANYGTTSFSLHVMGYEDK